MARIYSINPIVKISNIVMEASSTDDKKYMQNMSKDDIHQINGTLVQGLYHTILERKNCDFGDIGDSKGDITKCKYYKYTQESLDLLYALMQKNNIPTTDVDTINMSIGNMKKYTSSFEQGFQLKMENLIIMYNTFVMAIVDATSMLIADYMNYLLGPEQVRYDNTGSRNDKGRGRVALTNLQLFNESCKNGNFDALMSFMTGAGRKNFIGTGVDVAGIAITGLVIAALLAIIPIIRELIYFYYNSRVKISDYLDMQADFLELNKLSVQASNKSAKEKQEILKKQEKIILKCRRQADKLKINDEDIGVLAKKQVTIDNKGFSLQNIEKAIYQNKMNGTGFNIV